MNDGELELPALDGVEVAGLAVVFQRLAGQQTELLDYLGRTFATAMPDAVRVKRRGLLGTGTLSNVEIVLADSVFELKSERGQVSATVGKVVGGVALSHTPCEIDEWVTKLVASLNAAAVRSESVRAALTRLT